MSMNVIAYYYARKALTGIRRIETLTYDYVSRPLELEPLVELDIYSVTSKLGYCTIVFHGDGDGEFIIRVYVDNTLDSEFYTNEFRIGHYTFNSALRITIHNPLPIKTTRYSTSFSLRGIKIY